MFFSGKNLAEQVASKAALVLQAGGTVGDPACGAGDLLLATCSRYLADCQFDPTTLNILGSKVFGADIHGQLVLAAVERLKLLIAHRLPVHDASRVVDMPNFISMDYFSNPGYFSQVDCLVMNPPFVESDSPEGTSWTSGKVQQAAIFVLDALKVGKVGQQIVAVLPDVLRSGSRYKKWRDLVTKYSVLNSIDIYGRFDRKTDVDVFILHATKMGNPTEQTYVWHSVHRPSNRAALCVQDLYYVSVGAVVPHRSPKKGSWRPYLEVFNAPKNGSTTVTKKRRFAGRLHRGPFVTLRRTSSPSDGQRAVPTMVLNHDEVAVENHLIVVAPIDGKQATCQILFDLVMKDCITGWLNTRIRCRHLTTEVIKEIPLGDYFDESVV